MPIGPCADALCIPPDNPTYVIGDLYPGRVYKSISKEKSSIFRSCRQTAGRMVYPMHRLSLRESDLYGGVRNWRTQNSFCIRKKKQTSSAEKGGTTQPGNSGPSRKDTHEKESYRRCGALIRWARDIAGRWLSQTPRSRATISLKSAVVCQLSRAIDLGEGEKFDRDVH